MERQRGDYLSVDRPALAGAVDSLQTMSNGKEAWPSDFVDPCRLADFKLVVFPSDSRLGGGSSTRPFTNPNSFSQRG